MMNESKKLVVEGKMKVLRDKWQEEYGYTCYFTSLDEEKRNKRTGSEWDKIQDICQEIIEIDWKDDAEVLKRYQAEALCKLGMLYTERGEFDHACEPLETAKNIMESFSLQYNLPRHYIWTCIYMARTYTEKHREQERVEQYYKTAGTVLERILDMSEKTLDEPKDQDTPQYFDISDEYFDAITSQLKIELILQWVISRSNVYKQDKALSIIEAEIQQTETEQTEDKEKEKRTEAYLEKANKEISKFEEGQKKYSDDGWMKYWIRKQRDTYWATGGVYYKWLYFAYKDKAAFSAGKLRDRYFEKAIDSFMKGVKADSKNTICIGNIAALLYNYKIEIKNNTHSNSFSMEFLEKLLEKSGMLERFAKDNESDKVSGCITKLLDEVFKVDQNNMFALNLKALSERKSKDESYPYLALRQSSLLRRFAEMDDLLPAKKEKENKGADHADDLREIKVQIINLHAAVAEYMNKAIYPSEKFDELIVGHYTKASVLPKLLGWKGNSYLRIRNVKHLNDPSEGALFMGYINQWRDGKEQRVEGTADTGNGSTLISNLLQIYEYKRREEWNQKSSVYMGCFTSRIDQLNMWSQYGDAGKGCCLCIDATSFDEGTAVPLAEVSTEEYMYRYKMEDNQYPLYMVVYLPRNTEIDLDTVADYADKRKCAELNKLGNLEKQIKEKEGAWDAKTIEKFEKERKRCQEEAHWWEQQAEMVRNFEELIRKLSMTLDSIQGIYQDFCKEMNEMGIEKKEFERLEEEIINTIMMILDQVRFLVKDDAYREEREYRVIQYSYDPEYEENDGDIPKLYVNIEKELKYKKVVFGPLTQNYASDSAYVLNLCKKMADRKEGENTKLDVYKSEIPYCC